MCTLILEKFYDEYCLLLIEAVLEVYVKCLVLGWQVKLCAVTS